MNEAWPEGIYIETKIGDLILVALSGFKKKIEFEDLLEKCFSLFPKRFAFFNNTQWPDSRKLDRPLRSLREDGFVNGEPEEGFTITKKGSSIATQTLKLLRQGKLNI